MGGWHLRQARACLSVGADLHSSVASVPPRELSDHTPAVNAWIIRTEVVVHHQPAVVQRMG